MTTVVLVHGGAGTIDAALRDAARAGVRAAAAAGRRALAEGADAEEAAVVAVRVLEDRTGRVVFVAPLAEGTRVRLRARAELPEHVH